MAGTNEDIARGVEFAGGSDDPWDIPLKLAILLGLLAVVLFSVYNHAFTPVYKVAEKHGIGAALYQPSILWFSMGFLLMVFRTFLWFTYRPHPAARRENAPRMTVIIPAYNEGPMVAKSIDSVATADYDPERLEIVVVDDGSTDDTWQHIQEAAARYGQRVKTVRLERNSGKRAALAAGFLLGTGDVYVTVDSDSVVTRKALLALAGPFAEKHVGVVAGKVQVYNQEEGLIPRMLHVRFTLSFDFLRAYQSTFGTVYCSPGALSAYRASAVRQVLESWLNQRFLGAEVTTGEDRALTNDILRLGYDSVYQRDATVYTVVPTSYRTLCKMFLRWDRSYIREEVRFATIVWKRPALPRAIALVDQVITNLRFPVMGLTAVLLVSAVMFDPMVLLRLLVALGMISLIYSLYYLRSERSFNILYGVVFEYFTFFGMFWIFPWALLTVRSKSWMTR
ncbi:MAG TPA: glycosyltransferase family 2 protein [Terracidiphilus sp.]|nr:glycosyltransferase family 2 protein [Terracidiphilus sp.]